MTMKRSSGTRVIRTLLLVVGVGLLSWAGFRAVRMHFAQEELRDQLSRVNRPGGLGDLGSLPDTLDPRVPLEFGDLVARIEIPRVDLDVMALEGVRDYLLDKGAGHFHETAFPGLGNNTAFAGHRDTFFRKLQFVDEGDSVLVTTSWGRYTYLVNEIFVVDPEDVWVLDQRGEEMLTLITCYPFMWLGPAPRRIVVTALPAGSAAS